MLSSRALLLFPAAAVWLAAATTQAVPLEVGIGAFSGPPQVTFDGANAKPYTENGATFAAPGKLTCPP
jgi:hypothetical protein